MSEQNQENKRQYLEFIQNNISRMAQNSLLLKEITAVIFPIITIFLSSELLANPKLISILIAPILAFGFMDAKYLALERKYINLFNIAVKGEYIENNVTKTSLLYDFSLDKEIITQDKKNKFLEALISWSVLPFYLGFILVIISIFIFC